MNTGLRALRRAIGVADTAEDLFDFGWDESIGLIRDLPRGETNLGDFSRYGCPSDLFYRYQQAQKEATCAAIGHRRHLVIVDWCGHCGTHLE